MQERRQLPRWQLKRPCLYNVWGKGTTMSSGFMHDINLVGAKVYLKTPVAVYSEIRLELKLPDQEIPIVNEGRVIWQNPFFLTGFPTGIRFTLFKPEDKDRILKYFDEVIRRNWWREQNSPYTNKRIDY